MRKVGNLLREWVSEIKVRVSFVSSFAVRVVAIVRGVGLANLQAGDEGYVVRAVWIKRARPGLWWQSGNWGGASVSKLQQLLRDGCLAGAFLRAAGQNAFPIGCKSWNAHAVQSIWQDKTRSTTSLFVVRNRAKRLRSAEISGKSNRIQMIQQFLMACNGNSNWKEILKFSWNYL